MFKKFIVALLALSLSLCTACGQGEQTSKPSSSTEQNSSSGKDENKTENGPNIAVTSYNDKDIKDILHFEKGMDIYGDKTVNIIGDSISHGFNAEKLYADSWVSLLKKSINKKYGTNNIGYVSMLTFNNTADDWTEIHKVSCKEGSWLRKYATEASVFPGNCAITATSQTKGEPLKITVNRKQDGIDRHINGFYIYYAEGSIYGSFDVLINGKKVTTVNCKSSTYNNLARTPLIKIPADCGDEITIEIIMVEKSGSFVTICGMSYIDDPDGVVVNNYSLSGIKACDIDNEVLKSLAKANVVIFTLGTNDAGTSQDINLFKEKLDVVVNACKENGSTLIVGDVIWARYGSDGWASYYKAALIDMAKNANGYFVDFTALPINSVLDLVSDKADICHPTLNGHKLMALKLCQALGLEE